MRPLIVDIEQASIDNDNFRKVLSTTDREQLVVMSLRPSEDIGTETHPETDQFIRIERGTGEAVLDGKRHALKDGSALIVPAGTEHNIKNTSSTAPLKLYTVYSPPHHKAGTVHKTKADAKADKKDVPESISALVAQCRRLVG